MAIKVSNTTVINDSRGLENITNLKTVGGESILGTGDISVVSATNLKTINGSSLLGSGDLTISGGDPDLLPIGTLVDFPRPRGESAFNYLSSNDKWLPCNNAIVSQAAYPGLIDAVGYVGANRTVTVRTLSGTVRGISYTNGMLLATTNFNVDYSTDGVSWSRSGTYALANSQPAPVVFGNGLYAVLGGNNTSTTAGVKSTDLVTWTGVTISGIGSTAVISALFADGAFFVTTSAGVIARSTDLQTWTTASLGANVRSRLMYTPGLFASVSEFGNTFTTSTDGVTWTARSAVPDVSAIYRPTVFGNGEFAFLDFQGGQNSKTSLVTTTDWVSFTKNALTDFVSTPAAGDAIWYDSDFGGYIIPAGVNPRIRIYDSLITTQDGVTQTALADGFASPVGFARLGTDLFVANSSGVGKVNTGFAFTATDYNVSTEVKLPSYSSSFSGSSVYIKVKP